MPRAWLLLYMKGDGAYEGIRNKAQTNKILRRYQINESKNF